MVQTSQISKFIRCGLVLAALLYGSALSTALAQPVTVPTGLKPGDQYRLAFVTSPITDPFSNDINFYNDLVTSDAILQPELAALGTTWTAIVSVAGGVNARTNTNTDPSPPGSTGVPIYLLNDTTLALDYDDLWDGSIQNFFNIE